MNKEETTYSDVNLIDEVMLEEKHGSFPLEPFTLTPNQAH